MHTCVHETTSTHDRCRHTHVRRHIRSLGHRPIPAGRGVHWAAANRELSLPLPQGWRAGVCWARGPQGWAQQPHLTPGPSPAGVAAGAGGQAGRVSVSHGGEQEARCPHPARPRWLTYSADWGLQEHLAPGLDPHPPSIGQPLRGTGEASLHSRWSPCSGEKQGLGRGHCHLDPRGSLGVNLDGGLPFCPLQRKVTILGHAESRAPQAPGYHLTVQASSWRLCRAACGAVVWVVARGQVCLGV